MYARLSPAFACGRLIKPAPQQLVLLAGHVLIYKFVNPLEFAITCQKVSVLYIGQLLFNRGILSKYSNKVLADAVVKPPLYTTISRSMF